MIKGRVVFGLLLLTHFHFQCNWKLGKIINESDLVLESAWYNRPKKKKITHLTDIILQNNKRLKKIAHNKESLNVISFDYNVSEFSNGCSLLQAKNGYQILFDGYPTHSLLWNRTVTKPIKEPVDLKHQAVAAQMPDPHKFHYTARAFIEDAKGAIISSSTQGYNQENVSFDIVLSGSLGEYFIKFRSA
ncbi:hypothetical protein HYV11_00875 [Candidatus Dependentiae bacterium]|nr:hypothetical protein [Candidatus Dependentiae bacterium]